MKVYNFVFKGHNYIPSDRADNQGMCPHCSAQSSDKFMYDPKRDEELFLGYFKVDEMNYIACFECSNCFEKFYYHQERMYI